MDASDERRFAPALEELYSYLSDNLAPLLVAGALEDLFAHPELVARGVRTWVASHYAALGGRTSASTLVFHAARKIHLLGELKLLAREPLEAFLRGLEPHLLQIVPAEERDALRGQLGRVGEAEAVVGGSAVQLRRPRAAGDPAASETAAEAADALSPAMVRGLRRFALLLERGAGLPAVGAAIAAPTSPEQTTQLVAAAAETARNARELEQYLRRAGIAPAGEGAIRALGRALPAWVLQEGDHVSTYQGASAHAMERLVALAGDPQKSADRFREMVASAVEQINEGSLARALAILELAERVVTEGAVEARISDLVLGGAHEAIDPSRMLALTRDGAQRALLQRVLRYFPALSPGALLDQVSDEPDRQRRRLQLALLEVHGATVRELALDRLEASLAEVPRRKNAWWNERNYVYLLHVIPAPPSALPEREVGFVIELSRLENAAPLVRESIACLGQARHEKALPALEARLREVEEQLLQEGGPTLHPAPELNRFLNLLVSALARSGTSSGRRAVVAHALRNDPRLGDTLPRLAELGACDFAGDPETLERLLAALKVAIPVKVFGMMIQRDTERVAILVKALAATTAPAARQALADLAKRFADQPFGRLAAELVAQGPTPPQPPREPRREAPGAAPGGPAPAARAAGGLAGDLEIFGLPELLQSLAQNEASGQLTVRDRAGHEVAALWLRKGLLVRAQAGHLRDEAAFYLLFERPVQGTFEFARAEAFETTAAAGGKTFMPLLLEAMRRYDELQRAAALVPDASRLQPTGAKPSAPAEETDGVFVRELWTTVKGGATPLECEAAVAADPYRIRVLLAYWLEEGVLARATPA